MAGDHLKRALGIIEVLSRAPGGLPLQAIADSLEMPKSGAHRLLKKLSDLGWVRKDEEEGRHYLTLHLASLALRHLSDAGLADVAQPILDRLANESGEMVRLGAIDADRLFWVAKAQGARSGLRYDPDMGSRVKLACTATGIAWLAALHGRAPRLPRPDPPRGLRADGRDRARRHLGARRGGAPARSRPDPRDHQHRRPVHPPDRKAHDRPRPFDARGGGGAIRCQPLLRLALSRQPHAHRRAQKNSLTPRAGAGAAAPFRSLVGPSFTVTPLRARASGDAMLNDVLDFLDWPACT